MIEKNQIVRRKLHVETLLEINQNLVRIAYLITVGFIGVIGSIVVSASHVRLTNLILLAIFGVILMGFLGWIDRKERNYRENIFKKLSE